MTSAVLIVIACAVTSADGAPHGVLITPQNMAEKGFSFEVDFQPNPKIEASLTEKQNKQVSVRVLFDAKKGPTLKDVDGAYIHIVKDGEVVVSIGTVTSFRGFNPDPPVSHVGYFMIHRNLLPYTYILLARTDNTAVPYLIPLEQFYNYQKNSK